MKPQHMLLVFMLLLLAAGCATKPYVVPTTPDVATLVLINGAESGGYKVLIDGRDAGLLVEHKEIPVTPGEHTIRLEKKETIVRSQMREIEHKFTTRITLTKGEVKELTLTSQTAGYTLKEGKWKALPGEEEKLTPYEQRLKESGSY
ncbi:MAG TPA: hypothetical protein VJM80_13585 [bacterium]|nr:hypothetical protein [bacterium]